MALRASANERVICWHSMVFIVKCIIYIFCLFCV